MPETLSATLKPDAGPQVTIAEGGAYFRVFTRAEQPFAIDADEARILARTGLFEIAGASGGEE